MPTAFDEAFTRVKELVADFKANETYYLSPQFSEAQARKDFIDKFFTALGWDVDHDTQKNPYEQEVKVERNESGSQRRADYAFFLAPNFHEVRFFVEAKKPHGEFGSPDNYFQVLRYAWSSRTPVAVLTNFDETHILDSRYKPDIGDTLSRVIRRFNCADYLDSEKFAEIYWLCSREAIATDSLARFAGSLSQPKSGTVRRGLFKGGYQSLDGSFLIELDNYRELLAKAFKAKNPDLNSEQLTEVTQRTLDRLVLMRFLEDKQIEPQRHIERFGVDGGSAWEDFVRTCLTLDRIYNGIVFKRHGILDAPGFEVDEKLFRSICGELSDRTSPYNFDSIPIHILGSIYERFLGKIISDEARVVEKPEVRKAGGVYYTPAHIVRYMVLNTVGKLIEGKAPSEVAEMRFADIACGSGSFLLEIFDLVLRHHTKFYNENPSKAKKGDCIRRDDGLHLSLKKKQEILKNNVYGVDVDRQAVEVAQLSLYLKLLEDETPGSTHAFQNEFHFALLPSLSNNIVCGNSLIGTDVVEISNLTSEEERKLNPLDFEQQFPKLFNRRASSAGPHGTTVVVPEKVSAVPPQESGDPKTDFRKKNKQPFAASPGIEFEGGFDAIIGNPPWGQKEMGDMLILKNYAAMHFKSCDGILDLFRPFVERGVRLLKNGGMYGQVLPDIVLLKDYISTRKFLLETLAMERIDWWGMAFEEATIDAATIIGKKESASIDQKVRVEVHDPQSPYKSLLPQTTFHLTPRHTFNLFITPEKLKLIERISSFPSLGGLCEIHEGVHSGNIRNELFVSRYIDDSCHELYFGRNEISRYLLNWGGSFIRLSALPLKKTRERYANAGRPEWYNTPKLLVRRTGDFVMAAIDKSKRYASNNFFVIIPKNGNDGNLEFLCALLNSRFMTWLFRTIEPRKGRVFAEIKIKHLEAFPVPECDKRRQDKLVSLVGKVSDARRQLSNAKTDRDIDFYTKKCASLENQIDTLAYELYRLTAEEIKMIESNNN